jgi:hypothetical protein
MYQKATSINLLYFGTENNWKKRSISGMYSESSEQITEYKNSQRGKTSFKKNIHAIKRI